MIDYILAYRSQIAFMGLDFEVDKLRMNAEFRVIMTELQLKSNLTKLKTIPRVTYSSLQTGTKLLM